MTQFRSNITRVKGLSDRRRMPLLGKIRGGIKKKSKKTGNEYPAETDYWVCPPDVQNVHGERPKVLPIMFPLSDLDAVFPCAYVLYGSSRGVKCRGDGEKAFCVDDETREMIEKPCPCEQLRTPQNPQGQCKQIGRLLFMLHEVSVGGVYQYSTSSFNSIIDIQSGLDFVAAMVGRFDFIKLQLKRIPTITHYDGKKQTHYTAQITLPEGFNVDDLARLKKDRERVYARPEYQLPAPNEDNPTFDEPDEIIDEEDVINEMGGEVVDSEPSMFDSLDDLKKQLYHIAGTDKDGILKAKTKARITVPIDKVEDVDTANAWLKAYAEINAAN